MKYFNHVIQRKEHIVVFKTIPYREPQCLFSKVVSWVKFLKSTKTVCQGCPTV